MRTCGYVLCMILVLVVAVPVIGQSSAGTFFTGVNPRNITNVPIDTSQALKAMPINNAFRTPSQTKPFSLGNLFPKVHLSSWPPIVPNTPVLKTNPYQPNPIYGKNPFSQ
jgi:hypothetical protein